MKNLIITVITSVLISSILLLVAFNLPAHYFSVSGTGNLGLSLTDIVSSDTVSDFPSVQNANNTLIENSIATIEGTTTNTTITSLANLATVGTITSGTWQATDVDVAYGGTGTSSLLAGGLLYGSSTNYIESITACSTGQGIEWTSGGVPNCVDTVGGTLAQIFTNTQSFNATSTFWGGVVISATSGVPISLNGVEYVFPDALGASSSVLTDDGTGTLIWSPIGSRSSSTFFTASQTWVKPDGVDKVRVTLLGAGGGGANDSTGNGGGGGAAGAFCVGVIDVSGNVTVTIGSGGPGGTTGDGTDGGDTIFAGDTTLTAGGGRGGNDDGNGKSGGGCTNADYGFSGISGYAAEYWRVSYSGRGADSRYGVGGIDVTATAVGVNASGYGAGGSGGHAATQDGGDGSGGFALIEWIE